MQFVTVGVAALAIATIYYIWRTYRQVKTHRDQILRERVAYMLWLAAQPEKVESREMVSTPAD